MDIYRACYGLYGPDFLILGIKPTASCMPGTALPLSHPTSLFSSGDRVLLNSPKLILNLLCSPRMLQRIVMLQISRNYSCTYDRAHLILFSPSSQFSVHGLLHLWVDSAWGRQAGNPELGPLLVQPEFTCAKCLPNDENSSTRLGFCFSFTDHRTSFLKIWFPFQ